MSSWYPSPPSQEDDRKAANGLLPRLASFNIGIPLNTRFPSSESTNETFNAPLGSIQPSVSHPVPTHPVPPAKTNRLSKACDACSVRKVKCDEEGPPCRACRGLEIPCTFDRPSRRRGPPNKHAEAIKRRKLEADRDSPSPTHASPPLSAYPTSHTLDAESICSVEVIEMFIDDFFVYLHPNYPFPHEPSFRRDWASRRDKTDRRFLALVASMLGTLTAAYPRRALMHLKAVDQSHMFPSHLHLVQKCHETAAQARGMDFLASGRHKAVDAMTSYFIGIACRDTYRMNEAELYIGESFNILRSLGFARPAETNPAAAISDGIEREMCRRLYWSIFITIRSSITFAFGSGIADVALNPPTMTNKHPDLPLEIDDEYLESTSGHFQKPGLYSKMAGFNMCVRMYLTYDPLVAWELSRAMDDNEDGDRQSRILKRCIANLDDVWSRLPSVLYVPPIQAMSPRTKPLPRKLWESPSLTGQRVLRFDETKSRDDIAIEVQKASVYSSYLSSKSYFLERYHGLRVPASASPTPYHSSIHPHIEPAPSPTLSTASSHPDNDINTTRQDIASELLNMGCSVHPLYLEPNSFALSMKLRQIAATLIPLVLPSPTSTPSPSSAPPPKNLPALILQEFLAFLTGLEKGGAFDPNAGHRGQASAPQGSAPPEHHLLEGSRDTMDTEAELRHWADLRANQAKLAQLSGVAGDTGERAAALGVEDADESAAKAVLREMEEAGPPDLRLS